MAFLFSQKNDFLKAFKRSIAFVIIFCFIFEQLGLAQVIPQVFPSAYNNPNFSLDKFRPIHLRSVDFAQSARHFNVLLDKGDTKGLEQPVMEQAARDLMTYFFTGIRLPDSSFWVNLRPDSPDRIIDDSLARTDIGRIMLAADVQLKKDLAGYTSPKTKDGKAYWDKLYKKAEELFGSEDISIPTMTRPWIVPNEIILRDAKTSAYIYKATLKVLLESDYLKNNEALQFDDARIKTLNDYSSQIIRESILPKLSQDVNISKKYAPLRQVYYSLILAQWFKAKFSNAPGIDKDFPDLKNLTSKTRWSKDAYFKQYQESFQKGEYDLQESVQTPCGQTIRQYFSGGVQIGSLRGLTTTFDVSSQQSILTLEAYPRNIAGLIMTVFAATVVPHGEDMEIVLDAGKGTDMRDGGTRIPRPRFKDNPIDSVKLQEWVDAHPPEMRELIQFIADNIQCISQKEFEEALAESVADFEQQVPGQYLALLSSGYGGLKSGAWVLGIAEEKGMHPPAAIVWCPDRDTEDDEYSHLEWYTTAIYEHVKSAIEKYPDIRDLVIIDDAIYSGGQINNVATEAWKALEDVKMEKVYDEIRKRYSSSTRQKRRRVKEGDSDGKNFGPGLSGEKTLRPYSVHILVPFEAPGAAREATFKHRHFETIGELLERKVKPHDHKKFQRLITMVQKNEMYSLEQVLSFFAFKLPRSQQVPLVVRQEGLSYFLNFFYDGNVTSGAGEIIGKVQFLKYDIKPPYKSWKLDVNDLLKPRDTRVMDNPQADLKSGRKDGGFTIQLLAEDIAHAMARGNIVEARGEFKVQKDDYSIFTDGFTWDNSRRLPETTIYLLKAFMEKYKRTLRILVLGPGSGLELTAIDDLAKARQHPIELDAISLSAIPHRWRLTKDSDEIRLMLLEYIQAHKHDLSDTADFYEDLSGKRPGKNKGVSASELIRLIKESEGLSIPLNVAVRLQDNGFPVYEPAHGPFISRQFIVNLKDAARTLGSALKAYHIIIDNMGAFYYTVMFEGLKDAILSVAPLLDRDGIFYAHQVPWMAGETDGPGFSDAMRSSPVMVFIKPVYPFNMLMVRKDSPYVQRAMAWIQPEDRLCDSVYKVDDIDGFLRNVILGAPLREGLSTVVADEDPSDGAPVYSPGSDRQKDGGIEKVKSLYALEEKFKKMAARGVSFKNTVLGLDFDDTMAYQALNYPSQKFAPALNEILSAAGRSPDEARLIVIERCKRIEEAREKAGVLRSVNYINEFLAFARGLGIRIVIITSRPEELNEETRREIKLLRIDIGEVPVVSTGFGNNKVKKTLERLRDNMPERMYFLDNSEKNCHGFADKWRELSDVPVYAWHLTEADLEQQKVDESFEYFRNALDKKAREKFATPDEKEKGLHELELSLVSALLKIIESNRADGLEHITGMKAFLQSAALADFFERNKLDKDSFERQAFIAEYLHEVEAYIRAKDDGDAEAQEKPLTMEDYNDDRRTAEARGDVIYYTEGSHYDEFAPDQGLKTTNTRGLGKVREILNKLLDVCAQRGSDLSVLEIGPGSGRACFEVYTAARKKQVPLHMHTIGLTPIPAKIALLLSAQDIRQYMVDAVLSKNVDRIQGLREYLSQLKSLRGKDIDQLTREDVQPIYYETIRIPCALAFAFQAAGKKVFERLPEPFIEKQHIGKLEQVSISRKFDLIYDQWGGFFYSVLGLKAAKLKEALEKSLPLLSTNGIFFVEVLHESLMWGLKKVKVPEGFTVMFFGKRNYRSLVAVRNNSSYAQALAPLLLPRKRLGEIYMIDDLEDLVHALGTYQTNNTAGDIFDAYLQDTQEFPNNIRGKEPPVPDNHSHLPGILGNEKSTGLSEGNSRLLARNGRVLYQAILEENRAHVVNALEMGAGAGGAASDMSVQAEGLRSAVNLDVLGRTPLAPHFRLRAAAHTIRNWLVDYSWQRTEPLEGLEEYLSVSPHNGPEKDIPLSLALNLNERGYHVFDDLRGKAPYFYRQYLGRFLDSSLQFDQGHYDYINDDYGAFCYSLEENADETLKKVLPLLAREGILYSDHLTSEAAMNLKYARVPPGHIKYIIILQKDFPYSVMIMREDSELARTPEIQSVLRHDCKRRGWIYEIDDIKTVVDIAAHVKRQKAGQKDGGEDYEVEEIDEFYPDKEKDIAAAFLSFKEYMKEALYNPQWGYYAAGKARIGRLEHGDDYDFSTYPEMLSPEFGRMVADRVFDMWKSMRDTKVLGPDEQFQVLEFGAGNGTLALDMLTYMKENAEVPGSDWEKLWSVFYYTIGELSEELRAKQEAKLLAFGERAETMPHDARDIFALIRQPFKGVIFSNELLDAFEVHKIRLTKDAGGFGYKVCFAVPTIPFSCCKEAEKILSGDLKDFLDSAEQCRERLGLPQGFNAYLPKDKFLQLMEILSDLEDKTLATEIKKKIRFKEIYLSKENLPDADQREIEGYLERNKAEISEKMLRENKPAVIAVNTGIKKYTESAAALLNAPGNAGYAMTIDYGGSAYSILTASSDPRHAFRSMKLKKKSANPYLLPGDSDMTSDVNANELLTGELPLVWYANQGSIFLPHRGMTFNGLQAKYGRKFIRFLYGIDDPANMFFVMIHASRTIPEEKRLEYPYYSAFWQDSVHKKGAALKTDELLFIDRDKWREFKHAELKSLLESGALGKAFDSQYEFTNLEKDIFNLHSMALNHVELTQALIRESMLSPDNIKTLFQALEAQGLLQRGLSNSQNDGGGFADTPAGPTMRELVEPGIDADVSLSAAEQIEALRNVFEIITRRLANKPLRGDPEVTVTGNGSEYMVYTVSGFERVVFKITQEDISENRFTFEANHLARIVRAKGSYRVSLDGFDLVSTTHIAPFAYLTFLADGTKVHMVVQQKADMALRGLELDTLMAGLSTSGIDWIEAGSRNAGMIESKYEGQRMRVPVVTDLGSLYLGDATVSLIDMLLNSPYPDDRVYSVSALWTKSHKQGVRGPVKEALEEALANERDLYVRKILEIFLRDFSSRQDGGSKVDKRLYHGDYFDIFCRELRKSNPDKPKLYYELSFEQWMASNYGLIIPEPDKTDSKAIKDILKQPPQPQSLNDVELYLTAQKVFLSHAFTQLQWDIFLFDHFESKEDRKKLHNILDPAARALVKQDKELFKLYHKAGAQSYRKLVKIEISLMDELLMRFKERPEEIRQVVTYLDTHKVPIADTVLSRLLDIPEQEFERKFKTDIESSAAYQAETPAYQGTPYELIRKILKQVDLKPSDVLIDLGSGYGRMVIYAALTSPIKKSIGIELISERVAAAQKTATDLGLTSVEFRNSHVKDADLSEGTVFYLYNPFSDDTFALAMDKLHELAKTKKITMVFWQCDDAALAKCAWMKRTKVIPYRSHTAYVYESNRIAADTESAGKATLRDGGINDGGGNKDLIAAAVRDPDVREFILAAIRTIYPRFGVRDSTIRGIVRLISENQRNDPDTFEKILRAYVEQTDLRAVFNDYDSSRSLENTMNLIRDVVAGPVVVDIGCGTGMLSAAIARQVAGVQKVIATDVYDRMAAEAGVEFRLQPDPYTIPVETNSADTVVLSFVLHHVAQDALEGMLKEIRRILKPDGKVVILEDTYSTIVSPEWRSGYLELFLSLDEGRKMKALAFNDWFGNAVFRGAGIGMPYNFRSMEAWEERFHAAGFYTHTQRPVGMPAENIHFGPIGVFVLEKGPSAHPGGVPAEMNKDGGAVTKDVAGIDFRTLQAMHSQPMPGALADRILARLGKSASKPSFADLEQQWLKIEETISSGSIPDVSRLEGYVRQCCQSDCIAAERDKVLMAIAEILRLEEDRNITTEPRLKELLVLLDSPAPA